MLSLGGALTCSTSFSFSGLYESPVSVVMGKGQCFSEDDPRGMLDTLLCCCLELHVYQFKIIYFVIESERY